LCIADAVAESRWIMDAYSAILAAHAAWQEDFRSAVSAARNRVGIQITGRNPLENEEIIRTKLKRLTIAMLGGVSPADLQDASAPGNPHPTGSLPQPPTLNPAAAGGAGRLARFYEQAFEWENLAYFFYPYFWTGRDDWPEAALRTDPDPLYATSSSPQASRA
jgi:hypothetical protein